MLFSHRRVDHVMRMASVWILLVDTSASAKRVTMVMGLKAVYLPTNVNLESTSATKPWLPVSILTKAMNVTVIKALKEMDEPARTLTSVQRNSIPVTLKQRVLSASTQMDHTSVSVLKVSLETGNSVWILTSASLGLTTALRMRSV